MICYMTVFYLQVILFFLWTGEKKMREVFEALV